MPTPIFVSYSRQDTGLVKPVVGLLRATKDLVFQDIDGIMPGKRWRPQIEEALSVAHLIVLFWCHHSSRSPEVRKEYELALSTGKDVLPVLLDATPLPKELDEFQWVDFRQLAGLGHRSKRGLAIAAVSVLLMIVFLGSAWVWMATKEGPPSKIEPAPLPQPPLPTEPPGTEPAPQPPPLVPPAPFPWGVILFTATVLALAIWLVRRARRYRIRKKMAATLQEELLRRGISSA
jgi:TIR domain